MDSKLSCFSVKCLKFASCFSRYSEVVGIGFRVSKTFASDNFVRQSPCRWHCFESRVKILNRYPVRPLPNAVSCRILHFTSNLKNAEKPDPLKEKDSPVQQTTSSDHRKTPPENAETVDAKGQESQDVEDLTEPEPADKKPQGLLQRFKQTYREYGKILIGVHIFTSSIWAGLFYYAAASGIDVVPLLKWLGASDKIIAPFAVPGVGHAAVAYLMYKLATPLRYTVTIGGTRVAVNVLRRWGYLPQIPERDRLRSLMKEGRLKMRARYDDIKKTNQGK